MKQKIKKIQLNLNKEIASLKNLDHLESIRLKYLGRKGQINQLFQSLSSKEKAIHGQDINQLKNQVDKQLKQAKQNLLNLKPKKAVDVTVPGIKPKQGHLHLLTQTIEEVENIFSSLGFVRRRYPEVDTDWYYAEGLNIPKDHPARDDQETFYVNENIVLTAHTSNGQLREMERVKTPPIKMINIGKTYRRQASNTHSSMFHQFEGLMIDKGINITHLIGVSNYFARHYFGPDRQIRLRPHHFQFTEPSFEVDINCSICKGSGKKSKKTCSVCKAGWLELGGAGMVHPKVLKNGGIDPNIYSGFAFGWGIERIAMMKHNVTNNLRDLYLPDLRFLNQF
jgi:phenylalanyl-tRNA synthetase alpha chain